MDRMALRRTFGRFATGVTIVTCSTEDGVHGMTANSFTSVSLDPALVLISIDNKAKMAARLREAGHYGLNILSQRQVALSNHFAGRPTDEPIDFDWHEDIPLVRGAMAHLACRVKDVFPAGDHCLFVAEVVEHRQEDESTPPLLFYGGTYRQLHEMAA